MLSQQYTRNLIIGQFAAEVFNESAALMLQEQYKEADGFFQTRSGRLLQNLGGKPWQVTAGDNPSMTVSFVKHIRFLDLKKTGKGKKKKVYRRIYNRFFHGYIYGYAYKRLRYGFTQGVRAEIIQRLRQAGYDIPDSSNV
jgi:hypothetical protein